MLDHALLVQQLNAAADEQKRQSDELKRQGNDLQRLSEGQEHIVSFLNGKYQNFLAENGFATKSRYSATKKTPPKPGVTKTKKKTNEK